MNHGGISGTEVPMLMLFMAYGYSAHTAPPNFPGFSRLPSSTPCQNKRDAKGEGNDGDVDVVCDMIARTAVWDRATICGLLYVTMQHSVSVRTQTEALQVLGGYMSSGDGGPPGRPTAPLTVSAVEDLLSYRSSPSYYPPTIIPSGRTAHGIVFFFAVSG